MAYTTINKGTDHFRTKLYTGNATNDTAITFDESTNMKPDWLWIKNRSAAQSHAVFDSTRGATLRLSTNGTGADSTENTNLDSFDTNGFTVDNEAIVNGSGNNMVAWSWKANGGTTSSNTDGSITSTVQANTTAGFSIATWTGNGTAGATIGHGLGAIPSVMIIKRRNTANDWTVYHQGIDSTAPEDYKLDLNGTSERADNSTIWNDTAPTSSVATLGTNNRVNGSSDTHVGYFFAQKKGYSKFGSYTGIASSDSNFVYLGFKPSLIIIKNASANGTNWHLYDNKRLGYNVDNNVIQGNENAAELTNDDIDFLSNGFKLRRSTSSNNGSGNTMVYMAFAEAPIVGTNNVPANAR